VSALVAADLAAVVLAFAAAFAFSGWRLGDAGLAEFLSIRVKLSNFLLFLVFVAVWELVFRSQSLYRASRLDSWPREWLDVLKAVIIGTLLLAGVSIVWKVSLIRRTFLIAFFFLALLLTLLHRTVVHAAFHGARRRGEHLTRVAIVGCGPRGTEVGRLLRSQPDLGYLLVGYLDDLPAPPNPSHRGRERHLGRLHEVEAVLGSLELDEIIVALPIRSQYERVSEILATAEDLGLTVRMPADFFRLEVASSDVDYLDDKPFVTLHTPQPAPIAAGLKRFIDIVVAGAALIALAPLFAIAALAIRLDSPGPIFFRQTRVGLRRRRFGMLKFRSMVVDAESHLQALESKNQVRGAAFKIHHDPRVTRVGRILRRYSIDELPQLWNVLTGDMSLVGPRPLPLRDVDRFDSRWLHRRFSVKPGLTCLWQVHGRHELGFDDWMELDLQYIDQWTLGLDFQILLRTIPVVIRGTGAS
jgi:exopolysaccharide biosynthesis polyprenyl glycosylphosphotransferase